MIFVPDTSSLMPPPRVEKILLVMVLLPMIIKTLPILLAAAGNLTSETPPKTLTVYSVKETS